MIVWSAALAFMTACTSTSQTPSESKTVDLRDTSWRLVRFESGDGSGFAPADRDKYLVAFTGADAVGVRFDCNRGRGTWKSASANQIEFGPLALTRAMCAPGSHHDAIVKRWPYIRSYVLKGGHLFLSMQADGGIFELEPTPAPPT